MYIFTAATAGEQPKWGEPGWDERDEPDNRCGGTSLLILSHHTACFQPYKRQLVLIYFVFFRSITCNCMATLTAQTGGSMTKDGSCYSHRLFTLTIPPVVVALPLCSGSVSVCSFIGKALVTRRWVTEASVWTGRGGSQEPCHPSAPRLKAPLIPSPVSLVTLMLTHTHMLPVFVQIPQIPPDAAGATEQMSLW